MSKWVGYAVTVNCGEPLGCYQGTILEADGNTITLTKAFRNGFPYPKSQVTLNAADIKDLKIIESRAEPAEQTHSTVAVTKSSKKTARSTVCENLQANPNSSGNQAGSSAGGGGGGGGGGGKASRGGAAAAAPARSKPIDIQGPRTNKNTSHAGSYGNAGSTPKARGGGAGGYEKARRRNEACFGEAAEPALADDFDFESNLALFDKRALWEQMRHAHRPDVVRHADHLVNFRHDENVLGDGGGGGARRAITLPAGLGAARDYVTDDGVRVPAAGAALRRRLWDAVWRLGLGDAALTLLARAAADVALRLAGGGRRFDPRNAHQAPAVVALLGPHAAGAAGAAAARLLAAHGARATVHVVPAGGASAELRRELAAAARGGVAVAAEAGRLPAADVVLLALHDEREGDAAEAGAGAALHWARSQRAALVALEPPAAGWGVPCRAAVAALLPPALPADLGLLYLANVAPPPQAFEELGVSYRPPFGAAALLPLHPADPE